MKLATRLFSLLLIVGLAACGSADTSQPASSAQRSDLPATPAQTDAKPAAPKRAAAPKSSAAPKPAATPKPAAKTQRGGARVEVPEAVKRALTRSAGRSNYGTPKTLVPRSNGRPQYPMIVTEDGISPAILGGNVIPAHAPFELMIATADGKPYTVKLATPTPQTVEITPKRPGRISFRGLAPGDYTLQVKGTNIRSTLAVVNAAAGGQAVTRSRGSAAAAESTVDSRRRSGSVRSQSYDPHPRT